MSLEALLQSHVRMGDLSGFTELLEDSRVDVNWANSRQDKFTALHVACEEGKRDFVKELLRHPDIQVNPRDMSRQTPFWWACSWNREGVVADLLLDPRVDVNAANDEGETPLWTSAFYGYTRTVIRLIASGRRLDLDARAKLTPGGEFLSVRDIARKRGKLEVLNLIERYLCNPARVTFEARLALGQSGKRERVYFYFYFYFYTFTLHQNKHKSLTPCPPCCTLVADLAAEMLALIVLHCDGYLELRSFKAEALARSLTRAARFFTLASKLPLELQMTLCSRLFEMPTDVISATKFECSCRSVLAAILC